MAVKIKDPIFPINRIIRMFMEQTLTQLEVNAMTQHVWPKVIYNGFDVVNRKRKEMGMWYSTGEGAKSFTAKLVKADESGEVTLLFSFNDYMRYVDMGVGQGTTYDEVDSAKKARYKTRYAPKWDRKSGKSQRPAIMMELRHLQKRIRDYLVDHYENVGEMIIVNGIEDLPTIKMFGRS